MTAVWSPELLDRLRTEGDPEADAAARSYFTERADHGAFFRTAAGSAEDPVLAAWLSADAPLPAWAEPDRLQRGGEFFAEHGLTLGMALFCSALPLGYAAKQVANVLDLTARLESDVRHRVFETAQMVLDVTAPGAMVPHGPGHLAARRVRLVHAGVRWLVANDPRVPAAAVKPAAAYWDPAWGMPVSQEHLLGALLAFGTRSLDVLDTLGVSYDPRDAEDWLLLWSCVAGQLGVAADLLPVDRASGTALDALLQHRDIESTPAGRRLTTALLGLLDELAMSRTLGGVPRAAMHAFLGPAVAADLGVPPPGWARLLFVELTRVLRHSPVEGLHHGLSRLAVRAATRSILVGFVSAERKEGRPTFAVPAALADGWQLGVSPQRRALRQLRQAPAAGLAAVRRQAG